MCDDLLEHRPLGDEYISFERPERIDGQIERLSRQLSPVQLKYRLRLLCKPQIGVVSVNPIVRFRSRAIVDDEPRLAGKPILEPQGPVVLVAGQFGWRQPQPYVGAFENTKTEVRRSPRRVDKGHRLQGRPQFGDVEDLTEVQPV